MPKDQSLNPSVLLSRGRPTDTLWRCCCGNTDDPRRDAILAGRVIACLTVTDGEAAIASHRAAFDAEEVFRNPADGGKRLLRAAGHRQRHDHAVGRPTEYRGGQSRVAAPGQPTGFMLAMSVPDVDVMYNSAVAAGATPLMPPADMFWVERFCQLRDPLGMSGR